MINCNVCGKAIQNRQALKMHMLWKHNNECEEKKTRRVRIVKKEELKPETLEIIPAPPEPEPEEEEFYCGNCKAKINKFQKFCSKCMEKLDWTDVK